MRDKLNHRFVAKISRLYLQSCLRAGVSRKYLLFYKKKTRKYDVTLALFTFDPSKLASFSLVRMSQIDVRGRVLKIWQRSFCKFHRDIAENERGGQK